MANNQAQTKNTDMGAAGPSAPKTGPQAAAPVKVNPQANAAPAVAAKPPGGTHAPIVETVKAAAANMQSPYAHRTNQPVRSANFAAINVATGEFQSALNAVEVGSNAVDHSRLNEKFAALTAAFNALV